MARDGRHTGRHAVDRWPASCHRSEWVGVTVGPAGRWDGRPGRGVRSPGRGGLPSGRSRSGRSNHSRVSAARLSCRSRFVVTRVAGDADYPVAGTAGVTVSDDLRVRSDPGLAGERYELLPTGTPVWIAEGPVVAADYEWFQVVVPGVDVGDGVPRVGWVAASDHGVEPWLERAAVDCPDRTSIEVADLARLTSPGRTHEGVACFGSSTIRFRGTIDVACGVEGRAWLGHDPRVAVRERTHEDHDPGRRRRDDRAPVAGPWAPSLVRSVGCPEVPRRGPLRRRRCS